MPKFVLSILVTVEAKDRDAAIDAGESLRDYLDDGAERGEVFDWDNPPRVLDMTYDLERGQ